MVIAFLGAALVAVVAIASLLPVPYVVYSPGPMEDTLGEDVISIDGAETYDTDGMLSLTTVGVTPADVRLDALTAVQAWLDPERALVDRDAVYGEDVTAEEVRERNVQLLERSQETAKVAALRELGYEVPETIIVEAVVDDTPADGVLQPGDAIAQVDGEPVSTPEDVIDAVTAREPGESVSVVIRRDGRERQLSLDTVENPDTGEAMVGAGIAPGYELPVEIKINIDDRIGGPSAGTIFALAIYDTLTPGALLDGAHIAGTGTITDDGDIGPIGGIQQKIVAAEEEGADVFLAPAGNCDQAAGAPNGDMPVVPVETFDDALEAAQAVAAGETESLPTCS